MGITLNIPRVDVHVTNQHNAGVLEELKRMSAALDRLTTEVSETRGAVNSAVTLIQGLAQQIRDLKEDPVALEALANDLDQQQTEIAAAVAANTPPTP